jgi:hypothetical protein
MRTRTDEGRETHQSLSFHRAQKPMAASTSHDKSCRPLQFDFSPRPDNLRESKRPERLHYRPLSLTDEQENGRCQMIPDGTMTGNYVTNGGASFH